MNIASRFSVLLGSLAIALSACSSNNPSTTSATGSPQARGEAAGTIAIGVGVAQTSNVALLGQEQVAGAKIAEKYFNDRGGINGTPIKLLFQDTGGDEAGAINAFQTLINRDKVVGIVGPTLSQQAFSADPIANNARVPVVGPSNTAKGIPEIGEFVSRVSAPVSVVAPNSVRAALKINPAIKRVAIFFAQNDAL
jgi:amino acid-binding protein